MMSRIDSKTEVIQIVGRALRKIDAGTKKYGYVMLPLIISSTENIFEDEIAKLGFETIWNVVGALMDDDEELFTTIEDLSVATTSNDRVLRGRLKRQLSKHIDIIGIDSDSLYEAIQTHITSRLHSSFSVGLGHLKSYIDKNGSSSMPTRYTTEDGFPLSKWLANRKSEWTKGKLSAERIKELEKLGVTATTHTQQRKLGLQRLREYIDEHGHADITEEFYKDFPLKSWLASRRKEARKNTGNKKLINEIIKLGIPLRDKPISVFDQGKKHFTDYVKRVGDADVPTLYVTECGFKLGHWVITIRSKWRNKELTRSQVALLNKHGLSKHKYDDNFRTMIELLERMVRETGTINVPRTFTYEGKNVGSWLRDNRKRWRDNKLPAHRIKMLKDLGVDRGLSLAERRKRATKRSPTTKSRVKASATPKKKAS